MYHVIILTKGGFLVANPISRKKSLSAKIPGINIPGIKIPSPLRIKSKDFKNSRSRNINPQIFENPQTPVIKIPRFEKNIQNFRDKQFKIL